ncbi:MAG: hypothetical protein ACE5FK_02855 [Candidatus Methylomirabilia bacterium]
MARALTRSYVLSTAILALLVGAGASIVVPKAGAEGKELAVDVACDANTFAFQGPTNEGGGPAYGASFVVQGVIYPEGTFEEHGSSTGLLPNGEPEFPELVIGKWTCKGWFIGDGIATESGPFVVTTQIYDLDPDHPGAKTLVSEGIELIDQNVPFKRAVTGGTGTFKSSGGQVTQKSVGVNATGLFNFTFEFDIRR